MELMTFLIATAVYELVKVFGICALRPLVTKALDALKRSKSEDLLEERKLEFCPLVETLQSSPSSMSLKA